MILLHSLPNWVGWIFGIVAVIAAVTDIWKEKIYNWLTFPAFFMGLVFVLFFNHQNLLNSLYGILIAFGAFIPLFLSGIMGAGDAKLVLALSTVCGLMGTLILIYASIVVGAMGALVVMIKNRRIKNFFKELKKFFQTLIYKELEIEFPKLDRNSKVPFGIAICMGYFYVLLGAH